MYGITRSAHLSTANSIVPCGDVTESVVDTVSVELTTVASVE